MNKIFLGGTCNNSTWRSQIEKLVQAPTFNPVVDDWNEECQAIEMDEKENKCMAGFVLIGSVDGEEKEKITVSGEVLNFLSTGIDTRVYFIKNF